MRSATGTLMIALAAMLPLAAAQQAHAAAAPGGKIFCWKNKSGKTECGDSIPYEYQDSAIRELNQRGITVKKSDAALTPEQKKAAAAELERKQAEEQQRAETRRRDKALLDTFSNEKEIDLKRQRDVQLVESNIETLQGNLKNMDEREAQARIRIQQYQKEKRPVPRPFLDELESVKSDRAKTQQQIALKRKEIASLNQLYDALKKRYAELTAPPASAGSAGAKPAAQAAGSSTQKPH